MPRYWTCHWQFKNWNPKNNSEGEPVCGSGSNMFHKRGVSKGDIVYIVSLSDGQLYLGGRMEVKDILSRKEAMRLWGHELFNNKEWIADPEKEGTKLHLHRRLAPNIAKQLRFISKEGPRAPFFISATHLDNQATRGVRELAKESAELFDRIIEGTDRYPSSDELITVTRVLENRVIVQSKKISTKKKPLEHNPPVATFLLTWNPQFWNGKLSNNMTVEWSCGNTRRIRVGDRLFLMRQGSHPRGICASGVAVSDVISNKDGQFVKMQIEAFRDPNTQSILGSTLLDKLNVGVEHPMKWSIQVSGTQIPKEVARKLEQAWEKLCANKTANIPSDEKRMRFIDNELIRKIEAAAVALVTKELTLEGWSIHSREHEASLGFDLECSRKLETMHLEVKGTSDSIACFILQASQLEAASKNKHWKIAVVTNALHPENSKVSYYDGDTFLNSFEIDPLQYRASLKDK